MSKKTVKLSDWAVLAKSNQEKLSNLFSDRIWDEFNITDEDKELYIFQKVGVALTGRPRENVADLGLNDKEKTVVNDIKEKLIKHSFSRTKLRMSVIFVFVYIKKKSQTMVPLYRVMQKNEIDVPNSIFIDHTGRVYESFENYSDDNTWDKCWLCIPENGYYIENVEAIFWNQSARGKVIEYVDTLATAYSVTNSLITLAGTIMMFIPITAPVGAATVFVSSIASIPAAVYGVGRSVGTIVDRMWHEQGLSLADAEARQCWLVTGAFILSVGTMGSAKFLASSARAGSLASSTVRGLSTALNATSVSMSGLRNLNMLYEVARKDEVTALDVFQVTTSILFFGHSVVKFETASTIIKDIQMQKITNMRSALSPEYQSKHDAIVQASRERPEYGGKVRVMHGNAEFIKKMKHISDVNEFYSQFEIKPDNLFSLNNELTINPRDFLEMSEADRAKMFRLSKQLNNKEITLAEFNNQTHTIRREFNIKVDRQPTAYANVYLQEKFNVNNFNDIKVGTIYLADARPNEIVQFEDFVRYALKDGDSDYLRLAGAMADKHIVNSVSEYIIAAEYAKRYVKEEIRLCKQDNPSPSRGRHIKVKDFYKNQIVNELLQNDGEDLNFINDELKYLRAHCHCRKCTSYNIRTHNY